MRNNKGQFVKGIHPETEFKKGQTPWNKGKGCSEETREKIREKSKKRWQNPDYKKRMIEAHRGYKMSKLERENLAIRVKEEWDNGKRKGGWTHTLSKKTKKRQSKSKLGERNPNWKGGITDKNKLIRKRMEFKLWRLKVFKRDNRICQKCRQSKKELHAHHIKNFAQFPELQTLVSNGITFCEKCHRKFHKKYGKKNNTIKQLKKFLEYENTNNEN